MALRIADKKWDFVNPEKLPQPGAYPDFLGYVAEKLEMSVDAASVKNRAGYIVEAIRENYQDPELQKRREVRAEKAKQKALEDLTTEFNAKQRNILRQVVHAEPELVEVAAERVHSYIVRQRLDEHDSCDSGVSERWDGCGGDQRYPCGGILSGVAGTGCCGL